MKKLKHPVIIIIITGFTLLLIFLFYGPFEKFRTLWINTAMYSSRHQYLAKALYSDNYIEEKINIPITQEQTIVDEGFPQANTSNEIIFAELKGDHFKGYLIKLFDSQKINLVSSMSNNGQYLEEMVKYNNGIGGINAGGFRDHTMRGLPNGTVIISGEVTSKCTENHEHIIGGLTKSNQLVVGRMNNDQILQANYNWAFEFGPVLIVNGKKTELNTYTGGFAPRTAIGQTAEGHILLIVIDGRSVSSFGATFEDIQAILYENDANNAINLDGGASSCMVYQGELVNNPSDGKKGRLLPNCLVIQGEDSKYY